MAVVLAAGAALVFGPAVPAWAHGSGGRRDLPLELSYFLAGGGIVIIASFFALAVLWPDPRLQDGPRSERMNVSIPAWLVAGGQLAGLSTLVVVILAGLFGRDIGARSIVPVLVWVVAWLVVPFVSGFTGNVWAIVNPWRTLGRMFRFDSAEQPEILDQVGIYPAAVALLAFTWLELVYPDAGSPRALAVAAVAYTFYVLGMASWAGTTSGLQAGEFFSTYNRAISAIAPFGRDSDGSLVWRGWLRALAVLPEWKGIAFFVVVMIGTVSYDGLSGTPWWNDRLADLGLNRGSVVVGTGGLGVMVAVVGLAYWLASVVAARVGASGMTGAQVATSFAHSLVPIALAYAVAHYFTLVLFEGQLVWIQASDPLGFGWNLFGTADWRPVNFLSTTAIWLIQVIAIVAGHVVGMVLAYDRALAVFSRSKAVRSQYAMLVLLVLLTGLGLAILAAG